MLRCNKMLFCTKKNDQHIEMFFTLDETLKLKNYGKKKINSSTRP
jgi:hypothetical protein